MRVQDTLQGYSASEQKRIVEGAYQLGITPDDPVFRMMATLGRYEETIIDLQARMEAMIEAWAALVYQCRPCFYHCLHSCLEVYDRFFISA